jgi:hypothetical protein
MSFPLSYDKAVTAVFTMADSSTHTAQFGNRKNLELALKEAAVLGFFNVPVSAGVSKLLPLSAVVQIDVTEV